MGKDLLNENELSAVVGGKQDVSAKKNNANKKKEFDAAWKNLKMDDKGISGMKLAETFDEWEMEDFETDAATFISTHC